MRPTYDQSGLAALRFTRPASDEFAVAWTTPNAAQRKNLLEE